MADDKTVKEPVAILYDPDGERVIVGDPVNNAPRPPPEKASVAEVSDPLRPLPDTATLIPCGPPVGESTSEGPAVTVNGVVVPFTAIV